MDFFHQDQLQIPRHLALTVMWSNLSWCFAEKIEVLCNPQDHKKVHVHSPAGPLLSKEPLPCWIRDLSILSQCSGLGLAVPCGKERPLEAELDMAERHDIFREQSSAASHREPRAADGGVPGAMA